MALFTLLMATIVGCSSLFNSPLKQLLGWFVCSGESEEEKRLLQEVASLRRSLQNISMADQFAAWAKLQRQINALTQTYQQKASERCSQDSRLLTCCSIAVTVVLWALSAWYVWCSTGSVVASLPPHLLTPLAPLLAIPGGNNGEVSVLVWLCCVRAISSRLAASFPGSTSGAGGGSMAALWPALRHLAS